MRELGVGMVGYGFMGRVHTLAYRSIPLYYDPPPLNVRLVGVATAHKETAEKARTAGYEFSTTNWRELLERDDIHIINCCVPNKFHYEILIEAIKAGKHIYCDKPLARNLREAEEITDSARRATAKYRMAFQYRFLPATLRAKQLIKEDFLGEVFHFRACYLHAGYIDRERPMSWRLDKELSGGGALLDLGSHIIDLMRYLLGEFEEVSARTETFIKERPSPEGMKPVNVDDFVGMQVRLKSGAVGYVEASRFATGAQDDLRFELHGSKGALRFNLMEPNWLYAYSAEDPDGDYGRFRGYKQIECVQRYPKPAVIPAPRLSIGWVRAHIHSLYQFLKHIAEDTKPEPDFEDGLQVQKIIERTYESAEKGAWIKI